MIHVFNEGHDWEIWSDTEVAERDGRCIGSGSSKVAALHDAESELMTDLTTVQHLLECESQSPKRPSPAA